MVIEIGWPSGLSRGPTSERSGGTPRCQLRDADVSNFVSRLAQRQPGKPTWESSNAHFDELYVIVRTEEKASVGGASATVGRISSPLLNAAASALPCSQPFSVLPTGNTPRHDRSPSPSPA